MKRQEDKARQMAEARNKKGKQPVLMADLASSDEGQAPPDLPEITEHDLNFAKDLIKQYEKIPFDPLCQLVKQIRHDLRKYPEDFAAGELSIDRIFQDKIKGLEQLKSIKSLHTKIKKVATKEFETSLNYIVFMKAWHFFDNTDLGPQQKRIATGLTLQHFNLLGLTAEAQWRPDTSYSYYWQYLNDRIKIIRKRLKQREGPGDNPHINAKSI